MKFEGTHHVDEIRKAESAGQAGERSPGFSVLLDQTHLPLQPMHPAKMGRSRQRPLRKDWVSVTLRQHVSFVGADLCCVAAGEGQARRHAGMRAGKIHAES